MGLVWKLTEHEKKEINRLRGEGYSAKYVAITLGRDISSVTRYSEKKLKYQKWTNEEIDLMFKLKNKGYSLRQIGKELDRTREAVAQKYSLLTKNKGVD